MYVFISLEYILRSGIPTLYGKCIFNIKNCQTVFQSSNTILHSNQQCVRVPISPNPCQPMILSVFYIIAILVDVMWYFIVVLICFSLVANGVKHLFTYLIGHFYGFFREMSSQIYFSCIVCPLLLNCKSSLCILGSSLLSVVWILESAFHSFLRHLGS